MASLPSERSFLCRFSTNIFTAILLVASVSFPVIAAAQTLTGLHAFTGGLDGGFPESGVTLDRAGNLEGTAFEGGSASLGAVYKLTHNGSNWIASGLHEFAGGSDGARPAARVIVGLDGQLYGTTVAGAATTVAANIPVAGPSFSSVLPRAFARPYCARGMKLCSFAFPEDRKEPYPAAEISCSTPREISTAQPKAAALMTRVRSTS